MQLATLENGLRDMPDSVRLPESVCFRVTRFCNAKCTFCLAPPDGQHPNKEVLAGRIDWLVDHGVRAIHFCGGEPTIHPALPALLEHAHARSAKARLTTNGIAITSGVLAALRRHRTPVKVSLHGDRSFHNHMVGRDAFDAITATIRKLAGVGLPVTIQTTVVSGAENMVDWIVRFCADSGIRHLNILPFIPRGNGTVHRAEFELTPDQHRSLKGKIRCQRKAYSGRIDIKYLDFNSSTVPVVEADGAVVLEGRTEGLDRKLGRIPIAAEVLHTGRTKSQHPDRCP